MEYTEIPLPKRDLRSLIYRHEDYVSEAIRIAKTYLRPGLNEEDLRQLRVVIVRLRIDLRMRWEKSGRRADKFDKANESWLDSFVRVPSSLLGNMESPNLPSTSHRCLPFNEKQPRSQRLSIAELSDSQTSENELLLKATARTFRKRGFKDISDIILQAGSHPDEPASMRQRLSTVQTKQTPFSTEEALALLLDLSLTRDQYESLRRIVRKKGYIDILPPYYLVENAKHDCRPSGVDITDTEASVPIQNLLDHTAERLIVLQRDPILEDLESRSVNIGVATLIVSWGFDGSTGQSQYKQTPSSRHHTKIVNDSSLFATTIIPLQLRGELNKILCHNTTAQSTDFCRPLRLQFVKESKELVLATRDGIAEQISKLQKCEVFIDATHSILVSFEMHLTLVDGKILNFLTNTTSMQMCPLCKANPADFNKLENIDSSTFYPIRENLNYGASPLHAWIRFFECCLHISYRLELKVWRVPKDIIKERKAEIINNLRESMGLIVDIPKSGGSGNTNDGNTARRAFSNFQNLSKTLGINERLLERFYTILVAMSCQLPLNSRAFGQFCFDTAKLYINEYSWYPMPATVHKILIHGQQILECSVLPVGMFGEDAAESRNKLYRRYRERHARKCSRKANLEDVFNRSMETSDPLMTHLRRNSRPNRRRRTNLPSEVLLLLQQPEDPGDESGSRTIISASTVGQTDDEDQEDGEDMLHELDEIYLSDHLEDEVD